MTDKPGRLPSLRGPRDLTLGGVKKKTFAPNIPVRKERNKKEPTKDEPKVPSKGGVRKDRPRGRGRGRGRGRQEIIQSHSIFEAGPTTEQAVKRGFDGGFAASLGQSKDTIEKPTIKHEVFDEDLEKAKTAEALRNLEGESSFIEDLESDEALLPTCLPMSLSSWPPGSKKPTFNPLADAMASGTNCSRIFRNSTVKQEDFPSNILVLQLPDTLPIVPSSAETDLHNESAKVKLEPGVPIKQEHQTPKETDSKQCTLGQISEGYIGKLQVMKSGHCRLIMGGIVLDVHEGTPAAFLEELVSINVPLEDDDPAMGKLSVLGNVSHKLVCTPDMESLINQCKIGVAT